MSPAGVRANAGAQLPFDYAHDPSHLEEDFIEGEGNRLALAHVQAFPDWAGPLSLVVGPAKSGKSHLARIWAQRSGAQIPQPGMIEELSRIGGQAPLLLEDVDRLAYEEAALFHLLNQSIRDRRPVLMTAREAVANWPFQTDDLKSRARLAAHFSLALSDDIQLSQMFVKLYGDRQVAVDPKVLAYLVARMERSPEEAVALVGLTDRMAMAEGSPITRAIAARALAERGASQLELDLEGDDDE
jgi:chromosomal replication initiation ATPase DnaA